MKTRLVVVLAMLSGSAQALEPDRGEAARQQTRQCEEAAVIAANAYIGHGNDDVAANQQIAEERERLSKTGVRVDFPSPGLPGRQPPVPCWNQKSPPLSKDRLQDTNDDARGLACKAPSVARKPESSDGRAPGLACKLHSSRARLRGLPVQGSGLRVQGFLPCAQSKKACAQASGLGRNGERLEVARLRALRASQNALRLELFALRADAACRQQAPGRA